MGHKTTYAEDPRKLVCCYCHEQRTTLFHHIKYGDPDPLKNTVELCYSCHRKLHAKARKLGLTEFPLEILWG